MPVLSFRTALVIGLVSAAVIAPCQARRRMESSVEAHNPRTSSWIPVRRAGAEDVMRLHVPLVVEDVAKQELETMFWEVSNPSHPRYGKYVSVEDLTKILAVPDSRVNAVKDYFHANGATHTEVLPNRDMIVVDMPASLVEKALQTEVHHFVHSERRGVSIIRASKPYSLPEDIAEHVVMVGELLQFPRLRATELDNVKVGGSGNWNNTCSQSSCAGLVQPSVLADRYKITPTSKADREGANAGNSMAVAEFQGQYFSPSDNQKFGAGCNVDVKVENVIGGNIPSSPGVEAQLDIEYIKAVAPEIPLTVIYSSQFSLLNWVKEISANESTPLVHSVSYGNDEAQQVSAQYMETCNAAFMKAGARGLSILFASGDQGVCGREGCGLGIFKKKSFKPDFPAASPYITAVGGTNFLGNGIGDEEAWAMGGGGFSNEFSIPDYQASFVASYKSNPSANLPPSYLYNNSGRGYPDISALGGTKTPYCIVSGGRWGGVAGTSASTPVAAGIFARLNGLRLSSNKPSLGFLNPFIYKNAGAFQDVKAGCNNDGTKYGFTAIEGWDASTGVGTPDFEALSKVI